MCRPLFGSLIVLLLLLGPAASAQQVDTTVFIRTIAPDGMAITDVCYTFLDGASLEGCDENSDGYIQFQGIPPGDYTVRATTSGAGLMPIGDFPVTIRTHVDHQVFGVLAAPGIGIDDRVDIAIRAEDPATGVALPGSCMILHGGTNEGCDENGDGQIDFDDMWIGTFLLEETVSPAGAYPLPTQWVIVDRDGTMIVDRPFTGAIQPGVTVDVALVTRDPQTGDLLAGACYIIEGASIEGCDENGDGLVDFADVNFGNYILRQTVAPAGYAPVNPFRINIDALDPDQSIVVKQAAEQHDADHRHVSIVIYDTNNGQRVRGNTCLQLEGASLVGCDDNADGQIDFLDVPVGNHPVTFTALPPGYNTPAYPANTVSNDPDNPFSVTVVYIGLTPMP